MFLPSQICKYRTIDYEPLYCNRPIFIPPRFLQEINEPLHPDWKMLQNTGGGACLFKAGADHIFLKDFTHLRKYVHAHMIKNWDFYRSFYVFPLTIKIGSGELYNEKNIDNEEDYLKFLKSKESMTSYNTSDAEVVAMGNVLKVKIISLTYNIKGRVGDLHERTQWHVFEHNTDFAPHNIFSNVSAGEDLRLLHDDEVHYTKLIWNPRDNDD